MVERFFYQDGTIFSPWRNDLPSGIFFLNYRQNKKCNLYRESKNRSEQKRLFFLLKLPVIRFLLLFLHFVIFRLEMRTEPTTYNLLSTITFPEDLRQLSVEELPEVCKELRQDIIKEVSCNPGHFAASLGTVELTVALHYVFNTPYDRIVWDVGHQAYGHKILTGRREAFSTNRKFKGVRPFPSPEESDYDTFTCGHASNSISAALGMAVAAAEKGEKDRHLVAIIGDGSMSGGLAFEGLNNASSTPNNLLIILNDNDMSIDRSVGGMKQYLFNLTTSNRYNQLRFKTSRLLFKMGLLNEDRRKALIRFANSLKSMAAQQQNIFEGMNIRYFGPINGHDVKNIARVLRDIKDMQGPKILHLHTVKGKGFEPAEKNPDIWHAPGKFDPKTGKRLKADTSNLPPLYQDVFGETLVELAKENPRIVGVTPAMPTGCSMNKLMDTMPDRAFDVGIAEGHAATFSGGMAKEGMQPFCNIYSSFMQRAYDNVIHDIALLRLPVVLCLDRAGLVGEDGPTHEPVEQLAAFRSLPNFCVYRPCDRTETAAAWYRAVTSKDQPTALVLTRQNLSQMQGSSKEALKGGYILEDSKKEVPDAIIIASGSEVELAVNAKAELAKDGVDVRVVSMPSMEAFEEQTAEYKESVLPKACRKRVAVEALSDFGWYRYVGLDGKVVSMTGFGASGPAASLFEKFGFTTENVVAAVKSVL